MNKEDESVSLEEIAEVIEEHGPHQMDSNWQCAECGNTFNVRNSLIEHLSNNHKEINAISGSVDCKACSEKDKKLAEFEAVHVYVSLKLNEKEFEVLKRRHAQLKEKYEEAIKSNQDYSRDLYDTLKERKRT